jgi:glycyl-tRNA synthetase beta chain
MPELLLEIGTEEIPARFIHYGLSSLKEGITQLLKDKSIDHGEIIEYSTPRRLTLHIRDVSKRQKDRTTEIIGPPKKVAFDSKGSPTGAAMGFARSQNVDVSELKVIKTQRGEYVAATVKEKGRMTKEILSKEIPNIIASVHFPRSMRWGGGNLRFVRPIHWILALFDTEPVVFELDGIMSGNMTYGHRFISPGAIKIGRPSDYPFVLKKNYVIASFEERRNIILKQIEMLESENGIKVHKDEELLDTVTNLVEYPTVVLGHFEDKYLNLPKELLVTVMRSHQKYFSTEDEEGNLLPNFIIVSNTIKENNDTVRKGAERVLRARLDDARFYFDEDRKMPLWDYVEKLHKVTFHEELGNLFEKAERIASIGSFIADEIKLQAQDKLLRAAMLLKADLVTGVVREFPELQGYMGMMYALRSGEDEDVATAIYEHYLPRFHGDKLPSTEIGSILSISDKIDNIVSSFFLGLIPSGSEDPFALRRQASGIINILLEREYPLSLNMIVERALRNLEDYTPSIKKLRDDILRFFLQRFEGVYLSKGFSHDIIDAVSSTEDLNIKEMKQRIERLAELKRHPRFTALLTAVKRVYNILSKTPPHEVKENLLIEPAEKELYNATMKARDTLREKRYEVLFELEGPINLFFDKVLVMDKRQEIRSNRLALLHYVKATFEALGDLSRVSS